MIKDQDKRAIEAMCSCGMDLETLCKSFPDFSAEEIKIIFDNYQGIRDDGVGIKLGINCS
jgi:hypothetical protein